MTHEQNIQDTSAFSSRESLEQSEIRITPASLFADNRSNEAHDNMIAWDLNRFDGAHIVTAACADARLEIPLDTFTERVHTIATGGPKSPYENMLKGRNVRAAVALAHHDGDTVAEGKMPTGCGGLGAKAEIKKNGGNGSPVETYVDKDVSHEDVIVQACICALEIASFTDKPVLAATQDHVTGEIHPLLAFWKEKGTSRAIWNSSISIQDLLDPGRYDPSKIYAEGLPVLTNQSLPVEFQEYLKANRTEVEKLHEKYPNYHDIQKTQNPDTVILTSDIRPTRLKYHKLFEKPGSFFRLTIPRRKDSRGEDIELNFAASDIERLFQQVEYPIAHFSNVKNIIIETPSIASSHDIGMSLMQQPYMAEWLANNNSQIIAVETRGGKIYQPTTLVK